MGRRDQLFHENGGIPLNLGKFHEFQPQSELLRGGRFTPEGVDLNVVETISRSIGFRHFSCAEIAIFSFYAFRRKHTNFFLQKS